MAPPGKEGSPQKLDSAVLKTAVVAIGTILDATVVNVALTTLQREFEAPLTTIQWAVTGYALALATVIPWPRSSCGATQAWSVASSTSWDF